MTEMPRVGVGIVIARGDQVLLMRRVKAHGAGSWSTPGGHLDFGESPEACAMREVKEETNLDISNVRFRAITNDVFADKGLHYITIWMDGEYFGGEPVVRTRDETCEFGWFSWDALPMPLFLPFKHLLEGECYPLSGKLE